MAKEYHFLVVEFSKSAARVQVLNLIKKKEPKLKRKNNIHRNTTINKTVKQKHTKDLGCILINIEVKMVRYK